MTTAEQPITRSELRQELEQVLQHYATKADLGDLKADLKAEIAELRGELKSIRWTMGLMGIALSVVVVAMRFLEVS